MPVPDFAKLTYTFTPDDGDAVEQTPVEGLVTLDIGTYTLTVKAFFAEGDADPAVQGESASFTVAENAPATVSVTLLPEASEGTGVFTIAIAFPAAASVEALTLTPFPSGTVINLQTGATTGSGTLSKTLDAVAAGYYFLLAELKTTSGGTKYARRVEVVHIYKGLTATISAADWTFVNDDFQTQAAKVIANLPAGTYDNDQSVTLSAVPATAAIVYSTDGNAPSTSYSAPIAIAPSTSSTVTLKAKATADSWADSTVVETIYTFKAAAPVPSVEAGNIVTGSTVTLSSATEGAAIYYTTNGDTPTSVSTEYTEAITISQSTTLKAIAIKANYADSEVMEAAYIALYTVNGTIWVGSGTPTPNYTTATVNVTNYGNETIITTAHPAGSTSGAYTLALPVGDYNFTVAMSGYETKIWRVIITTSTISSGNLYLSRIIPVTSSANTGAGTLRQALADASSTTADAPDIIDVQVSERINLTSVLSIATNRKVDIRGNGITIYGNQTVKLLTIGGNATVTIRRMYFYNGGGTNSNNGGAIENAGTTTLESCIFSGNKITATTDQAGGAIYNTYKLTVRGCTFSTNSISTTGGLGGAAIYSTGSTSTLTFTGNLFYNNTDRDHPVIWSASGSLTSSGYNVSDKASGTAQAASGWTFLSTDKLETASTFNFYFYPTDATKLATLQIVPVATANYPETDFYGNTRAASASAGKIAAGAVWVTE
jgi:hypothetical protein